jgi:hypothetical protein
MRSRHSFVPLAGPALALALGAGGCTHRAPPVERQAVPRVEEGVVTGIQQDSLTIRTADNRPVAMPFDLGGNPEVVFEDTQVGTGVILEGTPVRVFYEGSGQLPAPVERIEILTGAEGDDVRERAARTAPAPAPDQAGILAPRTPPAEEPSAPGRNPQRGVEAPTRPVPGQAAGTRKP